MNILLSSVGRRSYLVTYFKEAVGKDGKVFVSNSSDISPAFNVADGHVVTPLIYDDNYIPFLLDYCSKNSISAIISLFDIDLPVLARAKSKFEAIGTEVIVSEPWVVDICNDKWKSFCFLTEHGIKVPKTFLSLEDAKQAIAQGIINFPIMIKPRWGMGSISIFEAENLEELELLYKKAQRKIFQTYLKFESKEDAEKCVILQEKIDGQEYGLDVINDLEGNYKNTIVKMKYAMRAGETDCAIIEENPTLKAIGAQLSSLMHHIGNLDVDVFVSPNETYVLEMNARFGGGYPFSHIAGVNLPQAIVSWLQGKQPDEEIFQARPNIMVQKDINLVRIYRDFQMTLEKTNDFALIREAIGKLEHNVYPSLSDRNISLDLYSQKLAKYAEVWILKGPQDTQEGILAGYLNDSETGLAYITYMAINEKYRGMRVGDRLLSAYLQEAEQKGMRFCKLEINTENRIGIKFYQSKGFQILEKSDHETYYMIKALEK